MEQYSVKDGKTPLSGEELSQRFLDIDGRLHQLELLKVSWQDAVAEVQNYGLERINNTIQPVLDQAGQLVTDARQDLEAMNLEWQAILDAWQAMDTANLLYWDSVRVQEIYIPAAAMLPHATDGAAIDLMETDAQQVNRDFLAFPKAAPTYAAFSLALPENWDLSSLKARIYWSSATGGLVGDQVAWQIAAKATGDGQTIDAAVGDYATAVDALAASDGAAQQITPPSGAITPAGNSALGCLLDFVIRRTTENAGDTLAPDAWLHGVHLQYRISGPITKW